MKSVDVIRIIQENYDVRVDEIIKIKNVYKVKSDEKYFCFKIIKYKFGHFLFIISAMKHLQDNGFDKVPKFIKTFNGEIYIEIENKHAYLTEWVCSRECNYDNPVDVKVAAKTLAELHIKSEGFEVKEEMRPRIGWNRWIEVFTTRRDEILDFKSRILKKEKWSRFDREYFDEIEREVKRCEIAIEHIRESGYSLAMEKEIGKSGFCHHDYANHNVLICRDNRVNIIDFDYCMLDTHLHDLASLLIRTMKNGKWNMETARNILRWYSEVKDVYESEIPIMAGFMEFPQAFWQVGIQYYWEEQPWGEEFFEKKLHRILDDRYMRQDFVDEFRTTQQLV